MVNYDYSQNDPAWRDELLGFSTYFHMGTWQGRHEVAAGCAVTSFAMMASSLGNVCNPSQMNGMLKTNGLINNNGDFTVNDTLSRLFSNIEFIERRDWPTEPVPLNYFDIINDVTTEIIVLIDTSPAAGLQQHWLRVRGWDGKNDILVVDPWDGTRKGLSAYAARHNKPVDRIIYAAIKFRKRPTPIPTTPPSAPVAPPPATPPEVIPAPIPSEPVVSPVTEPASEPPNPPDVPQSTPPTPTPEPSPQQDSDSTVNNPGPGNSQQTGEIPAPIPSIPHSTPDNPQAQIAVWRYLIRFLVQLVRRFS